jgi:hypothetical protein
MNSAKIAEIDAGLKLIVGESVLREYPQSKNFSWRHMEFLDASAQREISLQPCCFSSDFVTRGIFPLQ